MEGRAGSPHQEDDGRGADEGDGGGELPLVPSAVAPRLPLGVLAQPQLPHPPLGHLGNTARGGPLPSALLRDRTGPGRTRPDRTRDTNQSQGLPHKQ